MVLLLCTSQLSGTDVHFVMHADGLHCHDTNNCQLKMVLTVKEESEGFSKKQIARACSALVFKGSSEIQAPQTLS